MDKKLPKSIRIFLRSEKALIRRHTSDSIEVEKKIRELVEKIYHRPTKKKPKHHEAV